MRLFFSLTKTSIYSLFLIVFFVPALATNNQQPPPSLAVGYWQTPEDKAKQPNSIVQIWLEQGQLKGKVVKLFNDPNAICHKCGGDKRDKPVNGMTILWGFSPSKGGEWSNGQVLAVRRGAIFDAGILVAKDAQTLSLIIKTCLGEHIQHWQRVPAPQG